MKPFKLYSSHYYFSKMFTCVQSMILFMILLGTKAYVLDQCPVFYFIFFIFALASTGPKGFQKSQFVANFLGLWVMPCWKELTPPNPKNSNMGKTNKPSNWLELKVASGLLACGLVGSRPTWIPELAANEL